MLPATITVKKVFVNDKGPCKLIDESDKQWKFWKPGKYGGIAPDKFVEGMSYNVGYEIKPFDGKDEFYIKTIVGGAGPTISARRPVTQTTAPVAFQTQDSLYTRDELIFVEALGKSWIEKCAIVNRQVIENIVDDLRYVWRIKFTKSKIETGIDPDFNDEIPEFPGDR